MRPVALSSVQREQLQRLFRAAQRGVDPDRTGVGRMALAEFGDWGLITLIATPPKGRRVEITTEGLKALAAAPGTVAG